MAASAAPPTQDGPVTTTGKKCRLLDLICGPIDHNQPGGATKTQKNKTATRCLQGCDDNRLPAPSGKSCPLSIWTNQMENRSGTARGPVSTKQPNTNTSWVNFFHSPSGQTCPGLVTKWKPTDLGETRGGAQQATEEQHRLVNPSHFPSAPHCPGLVVKWKIDHRGECGPTPKELAQRIPLANPSSSTTFHTLGPTNDPDHHQTLVTLPSLKQTQAQRQCLGVTQVKTCPTKN